MIIYSVSATIVLEDGYTVATIFNGNKLNINPHSVLPLPGSSDLIILDTANSVFYTIQFPISQGTIFFFLFAWVLKLASFPLLNGYFRCVFADSVVKKFSGDGSPGYSDGDMGSAKFNKPKSFAVDFKGNVYVADKNNNVIRKITGSGIFLHFTLICRCSWYSIILSYVFPFLFFSGYYLFYHLTQTTNEKGEERD